VVIDAVIGRTHKAPGALVKAFVDTGALTAGLIHTRVAKQLAEALERPLIPLTRAVWLTGFDESPAKKKATHTFAAPITVGTHHAPLNNFYVADIGRHDMILGLHWLSAHGGMVDAPNRSVLFYKDFCTHPSAPVAPAFPTRPIELEPQHQPLVIDPDLSRGQAPMTILQRPTREAEPDAAGPSRPRSPKPRRKEKPIQIIGAAAFNGLTKQTGCEVFAISMKDIEDYRRKQEEPEQDPEELLPPELRGQGWGEVFSKDASNTLPPHRFEDMKIELKEGTQLPRTEPLRRLSEEEAGLVEQYVKENLQKGFVTPSSFSYASPILFVRKPGGGLRLCVDYRGLNSITKRDAYPLPLIEETVTRIGKAKWFTKLDIRQAFHRLRMMSPDDENLTTFATRLGNFKYQVMPFGLTNAPAYFQRFMNNKFMDMLDRFVSIYLDDILIYSDTREEHVEHIEQVLRRLRDVGLHADIKKSEFLLREVKYLGLIITQHGIKMDPEKIQTIREWEKPKSGNLQQVRRFLGFCNYYRKFIRGFSKIARPLNNLLKKGAEPWDEACDEAFERLKQAMIAEPVLMHFRVGEDIYVECDSSDTVTGGVMSQKGDDGELHPVAYFSKSMAPAERNYAIYDKELLAIVQCFEEWRPELMTALPDLPVKVLTDHQALIYFMKTQKLSRRQARWAQFLSNFNFIVTYRPGAANGKADALTRRQNAIQRSKDDPNLYQTVLPPEVLDERVKQDCLLAPITVPEDLYDRVLAANIADQELEDVRTLLTNNATNEKWKHGYRLEECSKRDGALFYRGRLAVPAASAVDVIQEVHCSREVGHAGHARTIEAVQRSYRAPGLSAATRRYIANCHSCRRAKPSTQKPAGLLMPLPVPERPWADIAMDFVVGLPENGGCNSILMVVDRLSKERHYIPCSTEDGGTTVEKTAEMLYTHVWRLHGLPSTIVSDRGPQFASRVWKELCRLLGIKVKLSTAYHPQTDGQSERANREMERYLRTFVSFEQDDWVRLLPAAEFAANAASSEATKLSPFEVTRGTLPRLSFEDPGTPPPTESARDRVARKYAEGMAQKMKDVWSFARDSMKEAQQRMTVQANKHRNDQEFAVGEKVWLSTRNLPLAKGTTVKRSRKLDAKMAGPFTISERKSRNAYRLQLPSTMRIHDVFHADLLTRDPDDPLQGQENDAPPPIEMDQELEWEVEDILEVRRRGRGIQARAKWVGWADDPAWYPISNFTNSAEVLRDFYTRHPAKPRPDWLQERPEAADAAPEAADAAPEATDTAG
jgi:transposase InsO family protein